MRQYTKLYGLPTASRPATALASTGGVPGCPSIDNLYIKFFIILRHPAGRDVEGRRCQLLRAARPAGHQVAAGGLQVIMTRLIDTPGLTELQWDLLRAVREFRGQGDPAGRQRARPIIGRRLLEKYAPGAPAAR